VTGIERGKQAGWLSGSAQELIVLRPTLSRRSFFGTCGAVGAAALTAPLRARDAPSPVRSCHLSLFLALGVPFEVTSELARDGITFLSDADARSIGTSLAAGTTLLSRPQTGLPHSIRPTPESLRELFAWKREILAQLEAVPYVEGEVPVVFAWFPTARAVLVWNLNEPAGIRPAAWYLQATGHRRRPGCGTVRRRRRLTRLRKHGRDRPSCESQHGS
jgi:hypothetical protein